MVGTVCQHDMSEGSPGHLVMVTWFLPLLWVWWHARELLISRKSRRSRRRRRRRRSSQTENAGHLSLDTL